MNDERRYGARIPMRLLTKARFGGSSHTLYTQNVALEGLFITTPNPPARHSLTYLEVTLSGDKRIRLHALVVRSNSTQFAADNAQIPGMGVQLYGLGDSTRRSWCSLIERIHEEFLDHYQIWTRSGDEKPGKKGPTPIPDRTTPLPDREWTPLPSGLLTPVMQHLPTPAPRERGLRLPRKTLRAYYQALTEDRPIASRPIVLMRIAPVDAEGVARFKDVALIGRGFRAESDEAPPEGHVVVISLIHPFTEAEAHFPARVSERRGQAIAFQLIGATDQTVVDYDHFVATGTPPPLFKKEKAERSVYEDAHEAQLDALPGSQDIVLLEDYQPL